MYIYIYVYMTWSFERLARKLQCTAWLVLNEIAYCLRGICNWLADDLNSEAICMAIIFVKTPLITYGMFLIDADSVVPADIGAEFVNLGKKVINMVALNYIIIMFRMRFHFVQNSWMQKYYILKFQGIRYILLSTLCDVSIPLADICVHI